MRQSLLAILFCLSMSAYSQTNFGLALGLDNSKFTGEKPQGLTYQLKRGFSLSGFVDFDLSDETILSIRPGYSMGGANVALDETLNGNPDDIISYPINNTSVNLAVLVKIFNRKKIYAFVGPEINHTLTSEVEFKGQSFDLTETLNTTQLYLDIGFGLNFKMFKQNWAGEWQFNQMLSTLSDIEDVEAGLSPRLRATRGRLALLYKFK